MPWATAEGAAPAEAVPRLAFTPEDEVVALGPGEGASPPCAVFGTAVSVARAAGAGGDGVCAGAVAAAIGAAPVGRAAGCTCFCGAGCDGGASTCFGGGATAVVCGWLPVGVVAFAEGLRAAAADGISGVTSGLAPGLTVRTSVGPNNSTPGCGTRGGGLDPARGYWMM